MLYVIITIILIFIFPLVLTSYIYFDSNDKKLYFAVYLFDFIKIVDGYITKRNLGGFYIHIKNKAIIIDDVILNSLRGGKSMLKAFHLTSLNAFINLQTDNFYLYYVTLLLNFSKNIVYKFLENNYFLEKPKTSINLSIGKFSMQVKVRFKILFNLFCITYNLITNYIDKGVQNVKASKQS
jgi:hypothetical protein